MKRIRVLVLLLMLTLLWPGVIQAQGQAEALRVLAALEKKYAELKDYTCDVKVHFDIETFRAPDLQARLYYKVPDQVKIESKRVLFFPREGGYFNPSLFNQDAYVVLPLGRVTSGGKKAVRLRLIPKKMKGQVQDIVLTIDTEQLQVQEAILSQTGGREVKAEIAYATFGGFELPTTIRLLLDLPAAEPGIAEGFGGLPPDTAEPQRIQGEIAISYADYQVNTGLGDELFKGTKSPNKP